MPIGRRETIMAAADCGGAGGANRTVQSHLLRRPRVIPRSSRDGSEPVPSRLRLFEAGAEPGSRLRGNDEIKGGNDETEGVT